MPRMGDAHQVIADIKVTIAKLEERVRDLEELTDKHQGLLEKLTDRLDSIDAGLKFSRATFGIISGIVGPVLTAVIVLLVQHIIFH